MGDRETHVRGDKKEIKIDDGGGDRASSPLPPLSLSLTCALASYAAALPSPSLSPSLPHLVLLLGQQRHGRGGGLDQGGRVGRDGGRVGTSGLNRTDERAGRVGGQVREVHQARGQLGGQGGQARGGLGGGGDGQAGDGERDLGGAGSHGSLFLGGGGRRVAVGVEKVLQRGESEGGSGDVSRPCVCAREG